jgi:hypothetical protein
MTLTLPPDLMPLAHSRSPGRRALVIAAVLVAAGPAAGSALRAQAPQPAMRNVTAGAGRLLGIAEFRMHSRDERPARRDSATGTARWRLERDTLDWRRKVTIRLSLDGADRAQYVIRAQATAPPFAGGAALPRGTLVHLEDRYFTTVLTVQELGARRTYDRWSVGDSMLVVPVGSLAPGTVISGTFARLGFHDLVPEAPGSLSHTGQQTSRYVNVAFSATFDPRPAPSPAMTAATQRRILHGALEDFAVRWVESRVNPSAHDSTGSPALARAALTRAWAEAAVVDSVSASATAFYVRMRGRHAPVTCTVSHDSSGPTCRRTRPGWWPGGR